MESDSCGNATAICEIWMLFLSSIFGVSSEFVRGWKQGPDEEVPRNRCQGDLFLPRRRWTRRSLWHRRFHTPSTSIPTLESLQYILMLRGRGSLSPSALCKEHFLSYARIRRDTKGIWCTTYPYADYTAQNSVYGFSLVDEKRIIRV